MLDTEVLLEEELSEDLRSALTTSFTPRLSVREAAAKGGEELAEWNRVLVFTEFEGS